MATALPSSESDSTRFFSKKGTEILKTGMLLIISLPHRDLKSLGIPPLNSAECLKTLRTPSWTFSSLHGFMHSASAAHICRTAWPPSADQPTGHGCGREAARADQAALLQTLPRFLSQLKLSAMPFNPGPKPAQMPRLLLKEAKHKNKAEANPIGLRMIHFSRCTC